MKLTVCIGSSCHLKGSYDVIEVFKKLLKKYELEDKVELVASFCLGQCSEGVVGKADEIFLHRINQENAEQIFVEKVLSVLK